MKIQIAARRLQGAELAERRMALELLRNAHCNHVQAVFSCMAPPEVSPRVYVPSKTQQAPGHENLRMMTTLHYCRTHIGEFKIDDFLTDAIKATFEKAARVQRPIDFKCDFDAAFVHYVDIFTPEYMKWLVMKVRNLEEQFGGVMRAGQ